MSSTARPAATVCLLRDSGHRLEVLMGRRSETSRFMGGAWVFPGGSVDDADREAADVVIAPAPDLGWRAAALRELIEELGIWITTEAVLCERVEGDVYDIARARHRQLDGHRLGYFANWVTPAALPTRFDTRFYVAEADAAPRVDGDELVDAHWVDPCRAIDLASEGTWEIAFPTLRVLDFLSGFAAVGEAVAHVESIGDVTAIEPRLCVRGDEIGVVLPGEDGFAEAASSQERIAEMVRRAGEQ